MDAESLKSCPSCRGEFPDISGPTHRYMTSSPGCLAAFGRVLAKEYSDYQYSRVHRLTVDCYAVQHPGVPSPQTIHSVALHLSRLNLILNHRIPLQNANTYMKTLTHHKDQYFWLDPPTRFRSTVADIEMAHTPEEHGNLVWEWARDCWKAWEPAHGQVEAWTRLVL
ncbi:MAG: hypothetical protein GXO90_05445 [FCB group bacterium]|nr:hypothetical protein [FCB group bacterium]